MTIIGKAQAETYTANQEPSGDSRLPHGLFAKEPFTLFWYPWAWLWNDEHGFLPDIGRVEHKPGVNGVTGEPGQRPNPALALNRVMTAGGEIFRVGDHSLGPWRNYLVSYPTNLGAKTGKHFEFVGAEFEKIGRDNAKQLDRSADWWAFLIYMRDKSGRVGPMPQSTYNQIREVEEVRLQRIRGRTGTPPEMIEAQKARLAAMAAAWKKMMGAEEEAKPVLVVGAQVEPDPLPESLPTPAPTATAGQSAGKATRRAEP